MIDELGKHLTLDILQTALEQLFLKKISSSFTCVSFSSKMAGVMNGSEKITVKAVYKFKASNNDEVRIEV